MANYHTQMPPARNNILLEVASENKVLTDQYDYNNPHNMKGTPIDRPNYNALSNPNLNRPPVHQNILQVDPQLNRQPIQQNFLSSNPQLNRPHVSNQQNHDQYIQKEDLPYNNFVEDNPRPHYTNQPQPQENINHVPIQEINTNIQNLLNNTNHKPIVNPPQKVQIQPKTTVPVKTIKKSRPVPTKPQPVAHKSQITNYLIMTALLFALFVFLVHPKTAGLIEKYVPKVDKTKGIIMRGIILCIVYVVIRLLS